MKRRGFWAISFLILVSLLLKPVFAQNITTGNATAKSTVETKIQGSGSVTTHIEVQANQEKKVLDANKPGNYSLSVESNTNSKASVDSFSASPSVTPKLEHRNFISNFFENIRNFFKRIFHNL